MPVIHRFFTAPVKVFDINNPEHGYNYFKIIVYTDKGAFGACYKVPESVCPKDVDDFLIKKVENDEIFKRGPVSLKK